MKILISSSYYSPHISGLTNSIKNLGELLAKNKHSVTVITTQHDKNLLRRETIEKVKVVRVPYFFRFHKGFFIPGFIFTAFDEIKKFDQVLINLPQVEGFIVAILAKLMNKKVHSIYACEVSLGKGVFSKIIEKTLFALNKIALNFSDTIITLTSDFANNSSLLKSINKNMDYIYPIILPPEFEIKHQNNLEKLLSKRKYYIGYVGRISSEKGIEYLLKTVPSLKKQLGDNFAIVLVGPVKAVGEGKYLKKIDSLIREYSSNIQQIGELEDSDLGAFYALMDVIVLPSINTTEAFGMVQVEAMFCGTPVVVTDLPGVRVPVQQTGMGEVASTKDSSDLAKKIILVLKNKKIYIKKKETVEKYFSINASLSQYMRLLSRK